MGYHWNRLDEHVLNPCLLFTITSLYKFSFIHPGNKHCALVPLFRNGECINLIGGFECLCPEGQEPNESHECVDLDECARDRNICPNGECVNTEAGT